MEFLILTTLLILVFIAWQDFKYRAVYWWLFVLLFLALGLLKNNVTNSGTLLKELAFNLTFLGAQLFFLTVYFSVKQRKLVNIFNQLFGLGDLLFLVCLASYFSTYNYIVFYLGSLFLVLLVSLIFNSIAKPKSLKIPLAGEQALLFVGILIFTFFKSELNFTSDAWIVNHLIN